jgi:outer membrane protein assembly factor BamB
MAGSPALAQVPFSNDLVPTRTALARLGLEPQWMLAVPAVGTERLLLVSITENLMFAQTNHSNFYVYDAATGRSLWQARLGPRSRIEPQAEVATPASANSQLVFALNYNRLFAMSRATGRIIWSKMTNAIPSSATAADEQRVMVGLSNGRLEAYYGSQSKENYDIQRAATPNLAPNAEIPLYRMGDVAWNWMTNAKITARPIPAGRVVAFASQDGEVYVALADKQKMLYRFTSGGPISGSMATHGVRTLLVPSEDNNLYALDLYTAEPKWVYPSGAPIQQEPLVAGDDAYVVNSAGNMSALDANTGSLHWTISTHGGTLLSVGAKRVYLRSRDGDLFIVDRASGQTLANPRATHQRAGLNLRPYTLAVTNHLNDQLIFATPSGLVICLRELGQVKPLPLRDPKLPPFGFIPEEGYPDALRKLGFPAGVVNAAEAAAKAAKEPAEEATERPK